MSLDMWLNRKIYVGANFNFNDVEGEISIIKAGEKLNIDFDKVVYVIERAGEWYGADAIHAWFVSNVQDDIDNCAEYYVPGWQLKELYELCEDVLHKYDPEYAADKLPVDLWDEENPYDRWYFESLLDTMRIIEKIMLVDPNLEGEYTYSSSW